MSNKNIPLDEKARNLIRDRFEAREDLPTQTELAARVGVDRSVINRILRGSQPGASRGTLEGLAEVLEIPIEELRIQYELDLEIDDNFVAAAEKALRAELERLRSDVGKVRAMRVTGSIGVQFHGLRPERRTIERIFSVPTR